MNDENKAPEKEPINKENNDDSSLDVKKQAKDMMDDVKGMANVKPKEFIPGNTKGMPTALWVIQILLVLSAIGSLFGGGLWGVIGAAVAVLTIWGINKRAMWAYWLLIAFIIYSIVVTIINWIPYSYVSLVIDAVLLYYIFQSKKWFVDGGVKK